MKAIRSLAVAAVVVGCLAPLRAADVASVDYDRDIRPILSDNCFTCHGPDEKARKATLRLDTREGALAPLDGDAGAVVPGKPADSALIDRITTAEPDDLMPPPKTGKKLTPTQIALLRRWVQQGAPYAKHWAFVAPARADVPAGASAIDHFVQMRLKAGGLQPNPPAEPAVLLRRVHLDLVGLPPTPQQVDAFLADPSPQAYRKVVDELLASPQFGEKWARPWLDLARYADSNGYQRDGFRTVWPYRDWVIKALNADMPYNRFVTEQLAGDLLPNATLEQKIATGFNRGTPINVEAGTVPEADRVNQVVDRVNTTATVFLGLTVECAQCHDHKYDPIPAADYYRLYAFFNNTPIESKYRGNDNAALDFVDGPSVPVMGSAEDLARRAELQARYNAMLKDCDGEPDKKTAAELAKLEKQIEAVPVVASLVMQELPEPRPTRVLKRGRFDDLGDPVEPGGLSALPALPGDAPKNRLGLAQWIASRENPLTARVAVNRWWGEIFGRGIVATPEDFGAQGEPPTHPQLLDWLAVELMESGWSMKHVLRAIVTSDTYRQSARVTPQKLEADPDNALLSRGPRFRMPAEMVRDHALAAAGLLSSKMHGPPVYPPQPPNLWRVIGKVDNTYRTSTGEDRYRRGLYTIWRRSALYPSFANFDATDRGACTVKRPRTNTPLQALTLLNDAVYVEAAEALAARVAADMPKASVEDRIVYAFRLCLARAPRDAELSHLMGVHRRELARFDADPKQKRPGATKTSEQAAWFYVATILLNLDETITKG